MSSSYKKVVRGRGTARVQTRFVAGWWAGLYKAHQYSVAVGGEGPEKEKVGSGVWQRVLPLPERQNDEAILLDEIFKYLKEEEGQEPEDVVVRGRERSRSRERRREREEEEEEDSEEEEEISNGAKRA